MSAPKVKRTDYDDPVETEIERWPGVTFRREVRAKHFALVLTFNGASKFLIYPATGSDRRGVLNHLTDLRAALRELGAVRIEPVKSTGPRRSRNRTEPRRVKTGEPATGGPKRDPWAALADFRPAEPEPVTQRRPTFWQRLWRRLRR